MEHKVIYSPYELPFKFSAMFSVQPPKLEKLRREEEPVTEQTAAAADWMSVIAQFSHWFRFSQGDRPEDRRRRTELVTVTKTL